ncbi:MAG: hypothetical protein R3B68_08785 [Phycisphaerales bacterium]
MAPIRKHIVTDENSRPVAVQIDYADWMRIERLLGQSVVDGADNSEALNKLRGTITLKEDPLDLQRRWRDEWP